MPPEETRIDHDELFTGPNRQNIVNAKAATLILRGVITTGQPPNASVSQSRTRAACREQSGSVPGNGSGSTTPTVTTPTHLSGRMAAIFAGLPTPTATPSPTSSIESVDGSAKENQPPQNEKPKDRRLVPNGPRPLMRRVVSATGVGLGVQGRGLSAKFAARAAARGRAASANPTIAGVGAGNRRRSSRLMNLYNSNSGDQENEGHDNNVSDAETESTERGLVPPSKKAKKAK